MVYKSADEHKEAAFTPSERDMPFDLKDKFLKSAGAKTSPVGWESYGAEPYRQDRRTNWIDRS